MNITNIALDDLVTAFADALDEANYKIREQHRALQSQFREKYGGGLPDLLSSGFLRVKRGQISIKAQPFLKKEQGHAGPVNRVYLNLNGLHKKDLTFEVVMEE